MNCLFCGKEISDGVAFCPYCGKPQEKPEKIIEAETMTGSELQPKNMGGNLGEQKPVEKAKRSKRKILPIVFLLAAIAASVLGIFQLLGMGIFSTKLSYANAYTKDITGIIYYMQNRFGKDIMDHSQLYELDCGEYGYIAQIMDGDDIKYSFILPQADPDTFGESMSDTSYLASMEGDVFFMREGMNMSEPIPCDSSMEVTINDKNLFLNTVTIDDYPEFYDEFPITVCIVSDDQNRIRRVMLMSIQGVLGRSDYTYNEDDQIIKAHWTSARFDVPQWEAMGWYSAESGNLMVMNDEMVNFLREMIVKNPNGFLNSIPDGKYEDDDTEYAYDDQGYLYDALTEKSDGTMDRVFSYKNGGRIETDMEWMSYSEIDDFSDTYQYDRNRKGFVVKLSFDDSSLRAESPSESGSVVAEVEYAYNENGYMEAEVITPADKAKVETASKSGTKTKNAITEPKGIWNLTSEKSYSSDGQLTNWEENEYDPDGHKIKHTEYNVGDSNYAYGSVYNYEDYSYNASGDVIEEIEYYGDGTSWNGMVSEWKRYEYNDNHDMIKEVSYSSDGTQIKSYTEQEYDEKGRRIKEGTYNADGNLIENYQEWEYGQDGDLLRKIVYGGTSGKELERTEYTSSEDGSRSYEMMYQEGNIIFSVEYIYDSSRTCIKRIQYTGAISDGNILHTTDYEYDSMGNVTKEYAIYSSGDFDRWIENEYDENGCRILQEYFDRDGNRKSYTEYEYAYYE